MKNFLDTQTGGTSDVSAEGVSELSKTTDLSPRQISQIQESTDEPSADVKIEAQPEQSSGPEDPPKSVQAVEEGKTDQAIQGVEAGTSAASKILEEYDEDEGVPKDAELDATDNIYSSILSSSGLSKEDIDAEEEEELIIKEEEPQEIYYIDENGQKQIIEEPRGPEPDRELDEAFPVDIGGNAVDSEASLDIKSNVLSNFNKGEDEMLMNLDGESIDRNLIPESEKNILEGKVADDDPPGRKSKAYYRLRNNSYYKDENGDWYKLHEPKWGYTSSEKKEHRTLIKVNARAAQALEDNAAYLIDKEQASENTINLLWSREAGRKILKDVGREDVHGNTITLEDVLTGIKEEKAREDDYIFTATDYEETLARHYRLFNYDGTAIRDLEGRMKKRIAKERGLKEEEVSAEAVASQLKPDGEYRVGARRYVKEDGQWKRLVKSKKSRATSVDEEDSWSLVSGYRKAKRFIGGGVVARDIKYDDVVGLEMNSMTVSKMSNKYIRWSISTAIEEFEDQAQLAMEKIKNTAQSGVDYVFDISSEKLASESGNPVLDLLDSQLARLNLKLTKWGYTTKDIERAELDLKAAFGDILNSDIEDRRVQFDLSTESLFYQNPYGLDAARDRVAKTYPSAYEMLGGGKKEEYGYTFLSFPLTDSEVIKYKAWGYLNENKTFSLPKRPGVYFAINQLDEAEFDVHLSSATKEHNEDGSFSWYDENGDLITNPRVQSMYESSNVKPSDVVQSYAARDYDLLIDSLWKDEGDFRSISDGPFNVKESSLYKLIFKDDDFASFLTESGSAVYDDPYFMSMLAVFASRKESVKSSEFMSLMTGNAEPSQDNFDQTARFQGAFASKLAKSIVEYNEYKDSEASLLFFIKNTDQIKDRTTGMDEVSFDKALDGYATKALSILLNNDVSAARKIEATKDLKYEITVWKENLNRTNSLLEEIRVSDMSVPEWMFHQRELIIPTLNNIGNSRYLETAVELYSVQKEILKIMNLNLGGEASITNEYTSALEGKLFALSSKVDELTEYKATSSLDEQAKLNSKLENLDKGIGLFRRLIESENIDPNDPDLVLAGLYEIPEGFKLDKQQRASLALDLMLLEKTKEKVLGKIESLETETNAFFKTDPKKLFEELTDVEPETIKPFISAIASGEGLSSKDKFDLMYKAMNDKRLQLERELNLSGKGSSSRFEVANDKLKALFVGLNPKEKEYYSLVHKIRIMTPLFLNNELTLKKESDGFFREFIGSALNFMYDEDMVGAAGEHFGIDAGDTKKKILNLAETIEKMNEQVPGGLEIEDPDAYGVLLDYGFSEDDLWSRDFWGSTMGVTGAIISMFVGTGFAYTKMFKGITGAEKFLRIGKWEGKGGVIRRKVADSIIEKGATAFYTRYSALMSKNSLLKNFVGPALEMGTRFKGAGMPFNQNVKEELTFLAGAMGGVFSQVYLVGTPFLGRKLTGMSRDAYAQLMKSIFGEKTISALEVIAVASGHGTAEMLQETGEELTHIWERSKNGQEFWKELDLQFGTSSSRWKFAVSTFVMGATMGIGAKSQMASAYSALNAEERKKFEAIKSRIKNQHNTIVSEAEKSREKTMQNAADVANATTKEETTEKVVQETKPTKPLAERKQVDPYKQENEQKKKRRNWQTESNSQDVVDDLQKRSENDEFVAGTTEENVLDVYNTLTEEQQNEVRNMSEKGALIKPHLVYQKILSLGKSNAESKSLDQKVDELTKGEQALEGENIFDPADELEVIKEYEQKLTEDRKESSKLIKEEELLEEESEMKDSFESEMDQTVFAENQGDVSYTDEHGNVIDRDRVEKEEEMQDALEDNYNYENLDEVNKETLRSKAEKELIEEERQRVRRNRRVKNRRGEFKGDKMSKKDKKNKMDLTPKPITEEAIEQRAEQIYETQKEQRANQTLGARTQEIQGERTTLTYNENKSEDSGNIVYDINDESGSIGQVSGRFNSDGDFIIEELGVNKSSGDFDLETIDAIAENVNGDIIIPGGSSLGKRLYDNDLALIDKNGNYLIPNTDSSITKDEGEIRAGDRLRRQLRRIATEGGITMNASPGDAAYNLAVEAAAKILDAGGSIVKSVQSAKNTFKNSKFYKNLKAEEQAESLMRLDAAMRESMTTKELIEYDNASTKSINEAVKVWQKNSEIYKNASRSEKARLTKEFKRDLQEDVETALEAQQQAKEKISTEGKTDETETASDVDKKLEEVVKETKEEVKVESKRKRRRALQDKIEASKNRVREGKKGMKILDDLKKEISQYAKDNLPKTTYSKTDVNKILNTISKVKDHKQLAKAFIELDNLIAKKGGQELSSKRKSTKSRISPRNLRKEFFKVKDSKKRAKMGHESVQEIQDYIAQMGGMEAVAEMNIEQLSEFNDVLDGLISTGKTDFKAAQKFIKDQRRRTQAGIITGFSGLNTAMDVTGKVTDMNSIRKHLSVNGNYIILNGKYYNKTDFKEFEADNIREFKSTDQYKEADSDQQKVLIETLKNDMLNLEEMSEDTNLSDDSEFKAYQKDVRVKTTIKKAMSKINDYANPINAAMDVYGLLNSSFKGNNQLKDFMQKNVGNKMPMAFAKMQQQVYEVQQEHRAKLEEIFGKGNFRKVTNTGEKFINAIAGGYSTMPAVILANAEGLVDSKTGNPIISPFPNQNNQKVKPSNDQLINIYNIARSSETQRKRLEKQGVDVDAINEYVEANPKFQKYADYLVDFYNNKGRELYEGAYQKYTKGAEFEIGKDGKEFYYPISATGNISQASSEQSIMDMIAAGDFKGVAMSINPDAFKERTNQGEIDVTKGATETFAKYNTQNSRYSNFADIITSLQTLFGNEATVSLIKSNMGDGAYNKLVTALSDSISGKIKRGALGDGGSKAIGLINTFGILGTLWGKPQQVFKQATSFTHFWNAGIAHGLQGEMPAWHAGVTGITKRKPFSAMYGAMTSEEIRDFEMSVLKSGFVQERWSGGGSQLDIDLKVARDATSKVSSGMGGSLLDWFMSKPANIALLSTRMGDMAGVLFGPGGGMTFAVNMYNMYKSEGMSHEEATKKAIEVFQVEATQAQQTTQIDNYSTASKNPIFRVAAQYRSSQGAAARKTLRAFKLLTSRTNLNKKEKAQAVSDLLYFGIVSPVMFTAVSGGQLSLLTSMFAGSMPVADNEDEDEVVERMKSDWFFDTAQSLMQGYAYSGYISDAIVNRIRGKDYYNNVPVKKVIENLISGAYFSGTDREKLEKSGEDRSIFDVLGMNEGNYEQLADLYDLFQRDKVFTEEFARTILKWDEVYMDPAFKNYSQNPKDTPFRKQDHSFELWNWFWDSGFKDRNKDVHGAGTGQGFNIFGLEMPSGYKAYKEGVRPPKGGMGTVEGEVLEGESRKGKALKGKTLGGQ